MKKWLFRAASILIVFYLLAGLLISIPQNISHYQLLDYIVIIVMYVGLSALAVYLWKISNRAPKLKKEPEPMPQGPTLQERIEEVKAITELPVVDSYMAIMMKPGEVCHYQTPADVLVIKNEVIGHTGSSAGVSVRVAKGVTLHSGGSRGHAVREDVAHTYPGILTMTNQRFIMTGEKGFDLPIKKLTAIIPYNGFDGITLQFGKTSYTLLMAEPFWIPKIIDLLNEQSLKAIEENAK